MSGKPIVIGGSQGEHIAIQLARILGAELGSVEVEKFPDGETYVRVLSEVDGKRVIYVNSLQRGPNEALVETLLTLDALRDLGAREVHAVIPYMSYARQDERFKPGEAVSITTVAKLFRTINVDSIYTVDMHLHRITDPTALFGAKFRNLTGVRELAKYVKANHPGILSRSVVVGPDEEAEQWAAIMARDLNTEYTVLEKKRLSATEVRIEARGANVKGKTAIIVDDIISTGGTIIEAVRVLRELGCEGVLVTCVHPLLVGRGYQKLLQLGLIDLVGTDTVLSPISRVPIAPAIAEPLTSELGPL
ncbi:MAG: ribose-phosphate diphosphokinase [Thermofilaceae archaeon]